MVFKHFVIAVVALAVAGSSHPPTAPDRYGEAVRAAAAAAGTTNSEATVQIPQVYSGNIKKRLSELRSPQAGIRGVITEAKDVLRLTRGDKKLRRANVADTSSHVDDILPEKSHVLTAVKTEASKLLGGNVRITDNHIYDDTLSDDDYALSQVHHVLPRKDHALPEVDYVLPREDQILLEVDHLLPQKYHVLPEIGNTGLAGRGRMVRDTQGKSGGKLQKRSYSSWSGLQSVQLPSYDTISHYKPPTYQLSRPYFIPVYGSPGRMPIYFPPQPFYLNPGIPKDNPVKKPYVGPTYLPPYPETTTKVDVMDRFNGDYDDEEGPVWGDAPQNAVSGSIIPTRAPKTVTEPATFPPIIHEINQQQLTGGTNHLSALDEDPAAPPSELQRPQRPQGIATTPRSTTFRPTSASSGPSSCVWAIVTCCSASSVAAPESCFEQRGCSGPFWGASPCEGEFARAAIESAINYYNTDG